jgi:hypothetical protein
VKEKVHGLQGERERESGGLGEGERGERRREIERMIRRERET